MALVALGDVKEQLQKLKSTDESALQLHLDAAESMVKSMCVPLEPATVTDYCDGGSTTVLLSQYPVSAVTSVTSYDTAGNSLVVLEAGGVTGRFDGWRLDAAAGVLHRVGFRYWPAGFGNIAVVYQVGPAVVPPEVERAVIVLVEHLWQFRRLAGPAAQPGLAAGDPMGYSPGYAVPNQVVEMLRGWLKPPRVA